MTRAQQKGALLRRKLGLSGQVDTEAVANILGFKVKLAPMEVQTEIEVGGYILVEGWGRSGGAGTPPTPWGWQQLGL